jgi:opacity protein-like surface antigen
VAALLVCTAAGAQADDAPDPNHWRLVVSPYTHHFRYSPEHRPVWALGIERQHGNGWLGGFTYFRNSFGQPSGYLYLGHRYERLLGVAPLFAQWSAGVLYGYKGKYQTKVPLNFNGYSPGVLLTAGWKFTSTQSVALHLLGDAAVMLQLAHEFR